MRELSGLRGDRGEAAGADEQNGTAWRRGFSVRSRQCLKLSRWDWRAMADAAINKQFLDGMKQVATNAKKILLVDLDDLRRHSRVRVLNMAGYAVDLRDDAIAAE